ncbi:hypothetical protein A3L11_00800 [Thermococcus siculi]|uniref:AAA+ ATPase domain-containing protein n=2 Tax=Thermococcus siculi TaxID=72803 RepID=A0A2Z2MMW2_9EURY|nr:hypothetical protein A3L11_00800 [Thermococcus siculi]
MEITKPFGKKKTLSNRDFLNLDKTHVGRFLWSPADEKYWNGHEGKMGLLKVGDIVLHDVNRKIVGYSSVIEEASKEGKTKEEVIELFKETGIWTEDYREFAEGWFSKSKNGKFYVVKLGNFRKLNKPLKYSEVRGLPSSGGLERVYLIDISPEVLKKLGIVQEGIDTRVVKLDEYFASKGYLYPKHLVSQFYTALKTKGFVILSSLTGTGKTKIAQELAELTSSIWANELPNVFSKWEGTDDEFENSIEEIQRVIKDNRFVILLWGPEGEVRNVEPPFVFWIGHQNKAKAAALVIEKYSAEEALREAGELSRGFKWNLGKYNETFESAVKNHHSKYGSAVVFKVVEIIPLIEPIDASEVSLRVGFKRVAPFKNLKFGDPSSKSFLFLSVRPNWRDSKALLGYYNPLTGEYHRTELLDFLLRAVEDYRNNSTNSKSYFVLLDEMNLAHVEYYFADFLSVLESGRNNKGFTREGIKLHDSREVEAFEGIPRVLKLPPNLYIIGTVNMDETTYSFSPKVLDRAFVVEFHDVDLEKCPPANENSSENFEGLRDALLDDLRGHEGRFLASQKEQMNEAVNELKTINDYWKILQELNRALEPYDLHFGYRVVDEIALFFKNAKESGGKGIIEFESDDEIFDLALLMKVLPKFHGNRKKLEKPLKEVLKLCLDGNSPLDVEYLKLDRLLEMLKNWEKEQENFRFKHTARKVLRMLRELYEIGFASFS